MAAAVGRRQGDLIGSTDAPPQNKLTGTINICICAGFLGNQAFCLDVRRRIYLFFRL
jgi:hypothetical protein